MTADKANEQLIRLELKPNVIGLERKHIDLWYNTGGEFETIVEVKLIKTLKHGVAEFRSGDLTGQRKKEGAGIAWDFDKLDRVCKAFPNINGIMLLAYVNPRETSNLDLSTVNSTLLESLREMYKQHKVGRRFDGKKIDLLLCFPPECRCERLME